MGSTLRRVMTRPVTRPMRAPTTMTAGSWNAIGSPALPSIHAERMAVKPTWAPMARFRLPATSGMRAAMAAMPVRASASSRDRQTPACKNFSGIQIENTAKMTMKM
ncbi:hypothetical protein G127AT_09565 [Agromyces archimandritae]|uniref:Uncharacterized protein n=1 Tax=Agromyces archimandritae TaxID=2781962 RepID=A0A975IQ74_9MICO|nr:hypothetical protein [Agromyces archimandritae]QTX06367.1 hypothetical protein G127AT_09565 [Agromyces archimandritae]